MATCPHCVAADCWLSNKSITDLNSALALAINAEGIPTNLQLNEQMNENELIRWNISFSLSSEIRAISSSNMHDCCVRTPCRETECSPKMTTTTASSHSEQKLRAIKKFLIKLSLDCWLAGLIVVGYCVSWVCPCRFAIFFFVAEAADTQQRMRKKFIRKKRERIS